jgi:hypothetical protein
VCVSYVGEIHRPAIDVHKARARRIDEMCGLNVWGVPHVLAHVNKAFVTLAEAIEVLAGQCVVEPDEPAEVMLCPSDYPAVGVCGTVWPVAGYRAIHLR